jgi:hypothetical protein
LRIDRTSHSFYSRFINYRSVIRADALVEAALGVTLLAGGFGARDFPHPIGRAVVVVVAVALLAVGVFLWFGRISVRTLVAANIATAVAAAVWLLAARGFSSAGEAVVIAAAGALACLAAAETATLRA